MSDGQAEIDKLGSGSSEDSGSQRAEIFDRPTGWRGFYYHPITQISLLGFVCFMCPGMFNALGGLGGGGQVNPKDQANANAGVYSTFAFFGFFSGSINNVIGPRKTLMFGTWGYSLYIASFLAVNIHPGAGAFVVASGAILGVCAAFLWTAQGSLMMSYPTEAQKGMFISIFWAIFNLGGVVGSAVAFGLNFKSTANSVGNGTYIGFLILTLIGVFLPLFMADPDKMVRTDGTRVNLVRHPSWKTEFLSLFIALKTDPWIILLFPMFLASNYFYTWQFNDYNGALFTIRARGLNNFMYWTSQIFGSIFIGYFVLDQQKVRRRVRAFYGWALVFLMIFVVHVWAYFYQKTYTRTEELAEGAYKIDIYDSNYAAHVWLMIFYGFLDSMWQTYAYWLMGAMSNDPAKLAVFTGFYKCMQSAGAASVWAADGASAPYMNIFLSTWCLTVAGMIFAAPMVYLRVTDHTDIEDEVLMHIEGVERIEPPLITTTEKA
ncbi:major facilitator superfamily domain-containing protein [Suillus subalutaceus]|uniref:major facilitator superfamily domain-containing protein n=1 Tax=Suillus subalutaceus TaxID=48586 RepID=UPI001B864C2D|nr:major facilitator superfamily domain-containing protein [Suillus subalutaceus]KAG1832618.1 major facilitator superfamily domain-containing protein [Suillus subalutaceus]